jgi:hypothetical protein
LSIINASLALVEGMVGLCMLFAMKIQEIVDPHRHQQIIGGIDIEKILKETIDSQ